MRFLTGSLTIVAMLAVTASAIGCHYDGDDRVVYIRGGKLVNVPDGGEDFGELGLFDTATFSGSISGGNDADGFPLDLESDALTVISVESGGALDPFVEIYDGDGNFVAGNDDGGVGADALLVGGLDSGHYTVLVWSSADHPGSGSYVLTVLTGTLGGVDFEDIPTGGVAGYTDVPMAAGADSQTYVFTLTDSASVDIDILQQEGGEADLAIEVVDQRGDSVAFLDAEDLDDPLLTIDDLEPGTYLIVVSNADAGGNGFYDISVSVNP